MSSLTPEQYMRWISYYDIEPWGVVDAAVLAFVRGSDAATGSGRPDRSRSAQTEEQMEGMLKTLAALTPAVRLQSKGKE